MAEKMTPKKTNQKRIKTVGEVLRYIGRYKLPLAVSLVLAVITALLTLYIPILVGDAVDCIVGPGKVDFGALTEVFARIAITVGLTAVSQWLMNILHNRITFGVVRDLRRDAFRQIQKMPLSELDKHTAGDIVSRVISDAEQFSEGLLIGFARFFTGVVTILGTLVFMLTIRWQIALVVVVITPLSLFVARYIAKSSYTMFRARSAAQGAQTAFIDEMIGNQKVVAAFGREEENIEKFAELNEELRKCSMKATFFSSLVNPSTRFVNNIVYAAVALVGALTVISTGGYTLAAGSFTVGNLTGFLGYANQYTKPFNEISGVITELQNALACAERLLELIHAETESTDECKKQLPVPTEGAVELKNVCFSYTPDRKLIENFSLRVRPGMRVAIVGPTGCGKTTLINLLMRFYDVNGGSIAVDGEDLREVTRHSLRQNYGMVLQDTWLKNTTVKENIAMGKPDATEEEIVAAAKAAHADGFIRRLPQGYDTVIGENGGGLSAGQKQLLCIARIFLCLPPMLILDEATSSIDTRTEIRIQRALTELMRGKTCFVVAHRLQTIKEADVILVMRDGSIVEMGNHDELLAKNGFYHTLYHARFAE